jgi:hypothetical protein
MKGFSKMSWKTIFLGAVILVLPALLVATGCTQNTKVTAHFQDAFDHRRKGNRLSINPADTD